ncbi:MAG: hypothetical protein HZB85_10935 [Deltaproteobacteria bacterium]|nr:hypothetical protein [Deltaproteobacteria bacterium]
MTAPSKNWSNIADTQIDADSPLDTTLLTALRDDLVHIKEWLGKDYTAAQNHSHDGADSAKVSMANVSRTGGVEVFDDFTRDVLVGWTNVNSGAVVVAADNGAALITTGASGTYYGIGAGICKPFKLSGGAVITFEARVKKATSAPHQCVIGVLASNDRSASDTICFDTATGANWKAYNSSGGTTTTTDTGVAPSTSYQALKIIATASSIAFYIDGVLKATHTTNIPTTSLGAVCIFENNSALSYYLDYIGCSSSVRV